MKKIKKRTAGILMSVTSLPSRHGCGSFAGSAYGFVDFASAAGFRLWQLLPLNPLGFGFSPYQPYSSMALDDIYLDLDKLIEEGLLDEVPDFNKDAGRVDFKAVAAFRLPYLKKAYAKAKERGFDPKRFLKKNPWAKEWGYYMMTKRRIDTPWNEWPEEQREWIHGSKRIKKEDLDDFGFEVFLQEKLYEQYNALRDYAHSKGLLLMGDLPFYSGFDSADVYCNQDQFRLHKINRKPTVVAGVPPDYFSPTGQRWGNPIYNWKAMRKDKYGYLVERVAFSAKLYDLLRLDHFRAFDTYYVIPSYCPNAMVGKWVEAPGYRFFDTLFAKYPDIDIVAEDLGDLRPEVLELRDHYAFPGMNVIQFTFAEEIWQNKAGLDEENSVAYLGTHDNQTTVGFIQDTLHEQGAADWKKALVEKGYREDEPLNIILQRFCLNKKAILAVLSAQDVLGLDDSARTNVPGDVSDKNWTWRITDLNGFNDALPRLQEMISGSGR